MKDKTYRFDFLVEPFEPIKGTATDIAREYCKIENIKLFTALHEDGHVWLFTDFSNIEPDTIGRIAPFENENDVSFEAGYKLFFKSYLQPQAGEQWRITELS